MEILVIQGLINGLIVGMIYGLVGVGLNVIFGVLRVVNFAQFVILAPTSPTSRYAVSGWIRSSPCRLPSSPSWRWEWPSTSC